MHDTQHMSQDGLKQLPSLCFCGTLHAAQPRGSSVVCHGVYEVYSVEIVAIKKELLLLGSTCIHYISSEREVLHGHQIPKCNCFKGPLDITHPPSVHSYYTELLFLLCCVSVILC